MFLVRPGDTGPHILLVKRRLGVAPFDEVFDDALAQRIRGIQMVFGLRPTGCLDETTLTAAGLEEVFRG